MRQWASCVYCSGRGSVAALRRHREREHRAVPELACHPDPSAVQLDELPAQREAEPRPLRLLVRTPYLPELLEDDLVMLGRDPDAAVGHRDLRDAIHTRRAHLHASALRRELHRVREEVEQHLLDLALVGADGSHAVVDLACERDPSPTRPFTHEQQRVVHRRRQLELRDVQLHASGLDLGQVEDVVDEGEEVLSRGQDIVQVLRLLLVGRPEHPVQEHVREADHGVERRAQLVRHAGEELRLVLARDFELPALDLQLAEEPRILDGEGRLGGEGFQKLDDL